MLAVIAMDGPDEPEFVCGPFESIMEAQSYIAADGRVHLARAYFIRPFYNPPKEESTDNGRFVDPFDVPRPL